MIEKFRLMRKMQRSGFTLIEVTIVLAVLSLIMMGISGIFMAIQQGWQRQRVELDLIQNCRWAIEFMSNELRQADSSTMQVTNNGGQLNFQLDPNGDGLSPFLEVEYLITGSILQRRTRSIPGSWQAYQELANFIVANPSDNLVFSWSSERATIELTASRENRRHTLRTQLRSRNQ